MRAARRCTRKTLVLNCWETLRETFTTLSQKKVTTRSTKKEGM